MPGGPGTPKVHHGTQNAVQVVVHLRNTQAISRKELPAALRRRSGHESSADWLTATEQRDKNVAAACSCLFYSTPLLWFSSIFSLVLFYPLCVLFSILFALLGSCSLALTLLLLLFVLLFSSPLFSLLVFFETLLSSSSWIVLRAFFRSLLLVHEFYFIYRRGGGRRILELGAALQSSSLFGQPVVRGATFLHQHLSVRNILIESLVAAVIPQVFQRPSQCVSIGSLSLVAPTAILIKLFCLLSLSVCWVRVWVCGSLFSFSLCSLLLYRLNLRGTLGLISYTPVLLLDFLGQKTFNWFLLEVKKPASYWQVARIAAEHQMGCKINPIIINLKFSFLPVFAVRIVQQCNGVNRGIAQHNHCYTGHG